MNLPLPVNRGNGMFVVQMLSPAFFHQDGEVVVGLNRGLDALAVHEKQREGLIFPDRLAQKILLDVGSHPECVVGQACFRTGGRNSKDRLRRGETADFLLQDRYDFSVLVDIDFVPADVPERSFVLGFVHLADAEPDAGCLSLGEELRFDGLLQFYFRNFHWKNDI